MTTSFYPDGVPPIMPDPDSPWGYLPAQPAALFTGKDGKDGDVGPQGPIGPPGVGTPGLDGRDGLDGAPGRDGLDGLDGAPGHDGQDGLDGAPGRDGLDGQNGADGRSILYSYVDPDSGDLMAYFSDGALEDLGHVVGPAGAKGDQGIQGIQGPIGPQGPPGTGGGGGGGGSLGFMSACYGYHNAQAGYYEALLPSSGLMPFFDLNGPTAQSPSVSIVGNYELSVDAGPLAAYRVTADFQGRLSHADTPGTSMRDWTFHMDAVESSLGIQYPVLRAVATRGSTSSTREASGSFIFRPGGNVGTRKPLRFVMYARDPNGASASARIRLEPGQYGYNFITVERVN